MRVDLPPALAVGNNGRQHDDAPVAVLRGRHCCVRPAHGAIVELPSHAIGGHCQVDEDSAFLLPSTLSGSARSAGGRHRIPHVERLRSEQPMVSGPQQMAAHPEEILYEAGTNTKRCTWAADLKRRIWRSR